MTEARSSPEQTNASGLQTTAAISPVQHPQMSRSRSGVKSEHYGETRSFPLSTHCCHCILMASLDIEWDGLTHTCPNPLGTPAEKVRPFSILGSPHDIFCLGTSGKMTCKYSSRYWRRRRYFLSRIGSSTRDTDYRMAIKTLSGPYLLPAVTCTSSAFTPNPSPIIFTQPGF